MPPRPSPTSHPNATSATMLHPLLWCLMCMSYSLEAWYGSVRRMALSHHSVYLVHDYAEIPTARLADVKDVSARWYVSLFVIDSGG